ncbi:MAG: acetyl-CoA carboxylase biotin carboxylase subunit [Parvibaculum sp.]|uniref:acetyl-CoA carboxylase biotin carboxylase subunit n=1 Tax=Parvibaculum sp. TaxID=2024848 RepID=UPI003C735BB6
MRNFTKILVANRGEIAVRVIRTARALGYRTVAVYSEADSSAPHVALADEAVLIGPAPVASSYLDPERLLKAAAATGADAVHPGYGFLSENAAFARACAEAGLVFIGPSADAIHLMGNKAEAKRRMIAAGVPCVPGYEGRDQSDAAFVAAAEEIGYPVMVKAAAGGGGRGMRLVERKDQLVAALASARSEALNAFGSDELILEKAVQQPRHVEIQVFGDSHGHVIHLGERDCSVQRRHQKVVEEAPCPVMTPGLRDMMGRAAVEAARSIKYEGAGTVEFLLDRDGEFYFLEMNTRLQVEHPVTELVTGLDLVALQLRVARGEVLPLTQDDVTLEGHAIEVRLYAEDPSNNFLPASGRVDVWRPASGDGVRIDHGLREGQEISPFYDPMIAKIIAWGSDRDEARRRLIRALEETTVFGPVTNKDFLVAILAQERFAAGEATTAFLAENFGDAGLEATRPTRAQAALASVLQYRAARDDAAARAVALTPKLKDWASAGTLASRFSYSLGEEAPVEFRVSALGGGRYRVEEGESVHNVEVLNDEAGVARMLVGNVQKTLRHLASGEAKLHLAVDGRSFVFDNLLKRAKGADETASGGHILAPMHGKILRLNVAVGDEVAEGQSLVVLEAMKMEHEINATRSGKVTAVNVALGDQVPANTLMIEMEQTASGASKA